MKKLLLAALTTLSFITVPAAAGERTAQGNDIYNPNNYRVEYTSESPLPLLFFVINLNPLYFCSLSMI